MKTVFCLNGEPIKRKDLSQLIGTAAVRELVDTARARIHIGGQLSSEFDLGGYGKLVVGIVQPADSMAVIHWHSGKVANTKLCQFAKN